MLRNHVTLALRTLRKHAGYTLINVLGLAVGLAACLLIGLWMQDELSYDRFHANGDRTYRVLREFDLPELLATIATTPPSLAPTLEADVAAVEQAVRVSEAAPIVESAVGQFVEPGFLRADAGFFELLSFPLVRGEARLDEPGTLVLTKYFPDADPIDQTLHVGGEPHAVTGVLAPIPQASHLQFDFVAALVDPGPNWGLNNFSTYVLLREGYAPHDVLAEVAAVVRTHTGPQNASDRAVIEGGDAFIPHLQPVGGIHLGLGVPVEIESVGNVQHVYLFGMLALFILLLAGINFVNLTTARSAERAKEVGMRKTVGASRGQLAQQFLLESVVVSALAAAGAVVLCWAGLPVLNALAGKALGMGALARPTVVLAVAGLTLLVGLIAGSYPALVLSRFQPASVLKGRFAHGRQGTALRQGLVVFQFALSIALLSGTAVVFSQLQFMRSQGLGFDQQNVLLIEEAHTLGERRRAFEDEVAALPGVEGVTSGFSMPGTFFINSMWSPLQPDAEPHNLDYSFVDADYPDLLGVEFAAGRSFSEAFATDSFAVVLNEAAARDFGWSLEEALGKQIWRGEGDWQYTVIGVAEDFHYRSLHAEVHPLALFGPLRTPRYVAVRLAPDRVPTTLARLGTAWDRFSDLPFTYSFLADNLAAQYRSEEQLARMFGIFAGLAVLLGCLGLFGLAALTAQQRTKEVGVRKVLGASVASLVGLLSRDFVRLVVVAFVLAGPLAGLAMRRWLDGFAYHADLTAWPFVMAGLVALLVALTTVSVHAVRAATADPVASLRHE